MWKIGSAVKTCRGRLANIGNAPDVGQRGGHLPPPGQGDLLNSTFNVYFFFCYIFLNFWKYVISKLFKQLKVEVVRHLFFPQKTVKQISRQCFWVHEIKGNSKTIYIVLLVLLLPNVSWVLYYHLLGLHLKLCGNSSRFWFARRNPTHELQEHGKVWVW